MIGSRVYFQRAMSPKDILQYGQINAVLWALLACAIVVLSEPSMMKSGPLAGTCVYVFYMMNQHRRMFVLGMGPSRISLFGGYLGNDEDFWRFMKETDTSIESLEKSFWWHFWVPLIISSALFGFITSGEL